MEMQISEVHALIKQMQEEYGFLQEEIKFITRFKPSFLLW